MKKPWRKRHYIALLSGLGVLLLLLVAGFVLRPVRPSQPYVSSNPGQVAFMAIGDQGTGGLSQWKVAHAMETIAAKESNSIDFVALLGDNFYGSGLKSVDDLQWRYKFENVYQWPELGSLPFYAILGNNDTSPGVEIDYSDRAMGSGRFVMPAHYYVRNYGNVGGRTLLRVIYLDTTLLGQHAKQQRAFLRDALKSSGTQPVWLIIAGHHPIRSEGEHGNVLLNTALGKIIITSGADVYMAGHDHGQQLLLGNDNEPAYIISGGGGQDVTATSVAGGKLLFSRSGYGFVRISVDASQMSITYFDDQARQLSRFDRQRDCKGAVLACWHPVNDTQ